jgi:hypothetical protein
VPTNTTGQCSHRIANTQQNTWPPKYPVAIASTYACKYSVTVSGGGQILNKHCAIHHQKRTATRGGMGTQVPKRTVARTGAFNHFRGDRRAWRGNGFGIRVKIIDAVAEVRRAAPDRFLRTVPSPTRWYRAPPIRCWRYAGGQRSTSLRCSRRRWYWHAGCGRHGTTRQRR